jgi:hypothetical protein
MTTKHKIGCVQHDCDECQARLAQPVTPKGYKQEPYLWVMNCPPDAEQFLCSDERSILTYEEDETKWSEYEDWEIIPLYTSPPKREWVGLTDEEFQWCNDENWPMIRVAEMLKEKNHD